MSLYHGSMFIEFLYVTGTVGRKNEWVFLFKMLEREFCASRNVDLILMELGCPLGLACISLVFHCRYHSTYLK